MTMTTETTIPAARQSRTARWSAATVSLGDGTLEDKLAAAAAAGLDGVELWEADLQASRLSPAEAGRAAAHHPIRARGGAAPGPGEQFLGIPAHPR